MNEKDTFYITINQSEFKKIQASILSYLKNLSIKNVIRTFQFEFSENILRITLFENKGNLNEIKNYVLRIIEFEIVSELNPLEEITEVFDLPEVPVVDGKSFILFDVFEDFEERETPFKFGGIH